MARSARGWPPRRRAPPRRGRPPPASARAHLLRACVGRPEWPSSAARPLTHLVVERGREVLPRMDADDLAPERRRDTHRLGVLLVPKERDDEDGHAGIEQEFQLRR